jgi:hypothetical protein
MPAVLSLEADRRPFRCRWVTDEETNVTGVPPVEIGLGCRSDTDFIGLPPASCQNSIGFPPVSNRFHIGITCMETDTTEPLYIKRSSVGRTKILSVSNRHHLGIVETDGDRHDAGGRPITSASNRPVSS